MKGKILLGMAVGMIAIACTGCLVEDVEPDGSSSQTIVRDKETTVPVPVPVPGPSTHTETNTTTDATGTTRSTTTTTTG